MNIFNGNPRLQELAMHALDWGLFQRHNIESGLAPFIFLQKDNEISIRVLMTDGNPVDYAKRVLAKEEANYAVLVFGIIDTAMPPRPKSYTEHNSNSNLQDWLFFFLVYVIFMAIMEAGYKGKTIGKFLTKTRAVNLDGSPISIKTAFARAFIRAIPLNTFSALTPACNPWHDKWTNTIVIIEDL